MIATLVFIVAGLIVMLCVAGAAWRFYRVRPSGVPACLRAMAGDGDKSSRWHHGVLVFGEEEVGFYRLRSLKPAADYRLGRHTTEIIRRRDLEPHECDYVGESRAMVLESGGSFCELAVNSSIDNAVVAWLESAPSQRQVRMMPAGGIVGIPEIIPDFRRGK